MLHPFNFPARRHFQHDKPCYPPASLSHSNSSPPPLHSPSFRCSSCTAAAAVSPHYRTQHKDIQILSRLELAGCHDNSVAFSSACFQHILPFFQSPCTRYLRYLDLGCCSGLSLGCDGVRCVAPCLPRMHMLQQLGLKKNSMGDAGVEALCRALHTNTLLVSLNLEQNGIGNQGCKMLAVAITPLSMLQRLFLCGNNIAARGVRELAPAVVSLTGSNLHSSSCRESSSGGGSFEISLDEEMMSILPLASTRWSKRGKLQEWHTFVHGAQRCFSFLNAAAKRHTS